MHTPGPWWAKPAEGQIVLNGSSIYAVRDVPSDRYNPDDIRLMARAPDMRTIIKDLCLCIEGEGEFTMWDDDWQDLYRRCKEVLGEQDRPVD